jgi:hypothetical protein
VNALTLPQPLASLVAAGVVTVLPMDWKPMHGRSRSGLTTDPGVHPWEPECPDRGCTAHRGRLLIRADDVAVTPRQVWGTCCPNDPECEHSYLDVDDLARWMDTPLPLGAVVASCTLADVVPIYRKRQRVEAWERHVAETANGGALWLWKGPSEHENQSTGRPVWRYDDISDQRLYGDFSPTGPCPTCGGSGKRWPGRGTIGAFSCWTCDGQGTVQRYAWLLEDVKATTDRCPRCWGEDGVICFRCMGLRGCDPVPMKGQPGQLEVPSW